jgi:tetratricopeptide (TPR) repeat protein
MYMKKIIILASLLISIGTVVAQSPNLDSLFQKLSVEKNDSAHFYLAFSCLTISETNPVQDMLNAEKLLVYAQKNNDKMSEVMALGCFGYDYRAFGNNARSLEYNLKANKVAEVTKDNRSKAIVKLGLATNYLDLADYPKAISYCLEGLETASKFEAGLFSILLNQTLGEIYLNANKVDSALIYTQRAYEQSMKTGITDYLGAIYGQMGGIQTKMKNQDLAISYFNSSLKEALKINSPKYINIAYNAIAEYYLNANQPDSAVVYSKKAIEAVQNTAFSTMTINPSKTLLDIYRSRNVDSAFKYSEMHRVANDSLHNIKVVQQAQLMTFEEDARQQEIAVEKIKSEKERRENIQYALMGLGIVTFIILFLLLSRSFITNTRWIEFFGVIALLIVFEFLNLLLHPFLERVTGHTPLFMLLALVCIAALLVPTHHKIEKWATAKLVEKNKAIRLAAAKKTIEKLSSP